MKNTFSLFAIAMMLFFTQIALADDPGNPGDILGGGGSGIGAQNENLPVDGGVSYLLAAGAAYGIKRLRKKKEVTEENSEVAAD